MVSTLCIGDYLWVTRFDFGWSTVSIPFGYLLGTPTKRIGLQRTPNRGEVIVFRDPQDPAGIDLVKRVLAVEGDTIEVREGVVWVNGQELKQTPAAPYNEEDTYGEPMPPRTMYTETNIDGVSYKILRIDGQEASYSNNYGPVTVPKGHFFAMGDNRDCSGDSRSERIGFVPYANLLGKVRFVMVSTDARPQFYLPWKLLQSLRWKRFMTWVS